MPNTIFRLVVSFLLMSLCLWVKAEVYTLVENDTITPTVYGYVKDQNNAPIANVVMSDGYSVVRTDNNGYYAFSPTALSEFVFISVPSSFDIPLDSDGAPKMYTAIRPDLRQCCDFTLHRQADGGKADSAHVMLAIADPQVLNNYDYWRYCQESIQDMKQLIASYPEGTKIYANIVGDIVWDWYDAFPSQKRIMASLGIPCFMTIGNHDHQASHACVEETETITQDRVADDIFTANFGPTYYSWNIGAIHYVVLDNVLYTGCNGNKSYNNVITQEQLDWLKKDVDMLPSGTPIVLFCHIPMFSEPSSLPTVQTLLNKGNVVQYIISGHTHTPCIYKHSARLWEHNLGAVEGAFWCSNWCSDGAPNGYEVLQAGAKGYTDYYYKATGYDRSYQCQAFAPNSIDAGNKKSDCVLANVWFYDEKWSVNIYENGEKNVMRQFTGTDPRAYDVMMTNGDTRPNYPGSDGGTIASKNPGSSASKQMFYYTPKDPDADFVVEVIDRFGNVYTQPVLRNMMAATFTQDTTGDWLYKQDFNTLPSYPNHFIATSQLAKGTFVQGHYPLGWYASTNGNGSSYNTFNYYRINNGSQTDGGLYSYGAGDPSKATANSSLRSMGSLPNSSNKEIAFGVLLENNTQSVISSFDIEYVGKVWHVGGNTKAQETLAFAWLKNPPAADLRERIQYLGALNMRSYGALSFTTPNTIMASGSRSAVDGDDANNRQLVQGTLNVKLQPGETLLLRWTNTYDTGNEQGLAIDDLVIKANLQETGFIDSSSTEEKVEKTIWNNQLIIFKNGIRYNVLGQPL